MDPEEDNRQAPKSIGAPFLNCHRMSKPTSIVGDFSVDEHQRGNMRARDEPGFEDISGVGGGGGAALIGVASTTMRSFSTLMGVELEASDLGTDGGVTLVGSRVALCIGGLPTPLLYFLEVGVLGEESPWKDPTSSLLHS